VVAEHRIAAGNAVGVLDDIADAHIVEHGAGRHAAVVNQVFELGLALQYLDARVAQPPQHFAAANHVQRVERQALVTGIEIDADMGHLSPPAPVERAQHRVRVTDTALLLKIAGVWRYSRKELLLPKHKKKTATWSTLRSCISAVWFRAR
jgi:hypothetical protein